jgi:TctA family transporter
MKMSWLSLSGVALVGERHGVVVGFFRTSDQSTTIYLILLHVTASGLFIRLSLWLGAMRCFLKIRGFFYDKGYRLVLFLGFGDLLS